MPPSSADAASGSLIQSLQSVSDQFQAFGWNETLTEAQSTIGNHQESKEQSVAARKVLADTTKQFKAKVKAVDEAGKTLSSSAGDEAAATSAVKAIEVLSKHCRLTVKSYQEEIDNLTKRCKSAEGAFATLAQAVAQLPDPGAVIATALEQILLQQQQMSKLETTVETLTQELSSMEQTMAQHQTEHEKAMEQQKRDHQQALKQQQQTSSSKGMSKADQEELLQLRNEVAEYEVEFRSLKNQDITIRKLEKRIEELQAAGETELEDRLEQAKQEIAETEGRRAAEALEREAAMERKLQNLELQLKAEMAGRAATQAHLLEADEGAGEREAAWEAQRRILVDDAERLRLSLHEATRERDELRLKVAATDSTSGEGAGGTRSGSSSSPPSGSIAMSDLLNERQAYEAEVAELSHTANSLREEVALKDDAINEIRTTLQGKISNLEQERDLLNSNLASLETQLAAAPSQSFVDSMKRELRILKRLEYNAEETEDVELGERDPEVTEDPEKDLESVLVAKLRRVESELVKERNQNSETKEQLEKLQDQVVALEQSKEEADKLITSLEQDLDRATSAPAASPQKRQDSLEIPLAQENPATLQQVLDPEAPAPPQSNQQEQATPAAEAKTEKEEDDHSVATIIMAQRDRLRARCEALEAERDSFKHELQAQVAAAESLKADNTKMFEKMRYLQSYNKSGSSVGGAYSRSNSRDLDLEALEQRYEASVDPFRQFGRQERQRKLNEMSPMERTVFVVAKTVLSTKEMRTFLFVYVLALHSLVFMTTYHWSHASDCGFQDNEHLSHLPPNNADHIKSDFGNN